MLAIIPIIIPQRIGGSKPPEVHHILWSVSILLLIVFIVVLIINILSCKSWKKYRHFELWGLTLFIGMATVLCFLLGCTSIAIDFILLHVFNYK